MTTITITMSERRPLKIDSEEWPVVAEASRHSGAVKSQANQEWFIKVRQHADGRRLVYGRLQPGDGGVPAGWRGAAGGFLVEASERGKDNPNEDETVRAIRRVAGIVDDDALADECIGDLPAEEI
jgi:hypothetical protein